MIKLIFPLLIIAGIIWWVNAVSFPDAYFAGLFSNNTAVSNEATTSDSVSSDSAEPIPAESVALPSPVHSALPEPSAPPESLIKQADGFQQLRAQKYVYQTYNNCGPASLSMLLDYWGIDVTQQEIADQLRPYQHPRGIGDDKAVTLDELADYAEKSGLKTFKRPNGDIQKLKLFLENEIPVLTLAWLNEKGGFGHYRIVKGYDDSGSYLSEDDSIYGTGQKIPYANFMTDWQVFNYEYLIIIPPEKEQLVIQILADESVVEISYKNALAKAQNEYTQNTSNPFPLFNQSTSRYYLGQSEDAITLYESVKDKLPQRLLWYQTEPILAYQKAGKYEKVLELTDQIFRQGNIAFSEMYFLRGQAYLVHGQKEAARSELEKAAIYNKNFEPAKTALLDL